MIEFEFEKFTTRRGYSCSREQVPRILIEVCEVKKASFLMPETENNVHSLSLRGQNKAIASCMYSHWSEASPH